jgi:hypothetical protein
MNFTTDLTDNTEKGRCSNGEGGRGEDEYRQSGEKKGARPVFWTR